MKTEKKRDFQNQGVTGQCFSENSGYRGILSLPGILERTREPDSRHEISRQRKLAVSCQVMSGAISVLYVIPRIVSATFLFREWVVHSSEEKEKVADAKYCATV